MVLCIQILSVYHTFSATVLVLFVKPDVSWAVDSFLLKICYLGHGAVNNSCFCLQPIVGFMFPKIQISYIYHTFCAAVLIVSIKRDDLFSINNTCSYLRPIIGPML